MSVHLTEHRQAGASRCIALVGLDGELIPRSGTTDLSAAELALELAEQLRGSCAAVVTISVAVGPEEVA